MYLHQNTMHSTKRTSHEKSQSLTTQHPDNTTHSSTPRERHVWRHSRQLGTPTQVFGFVSAGTPLRKTTTVNDFAEVSVSQYDFLTMPTYVLVSRLLSDTYSIAYSITYFLRAACQACVFFAADASNAVTGQSLSVDGGLTMP